MAPGLSRPTTATPTTTRAGSTKSRRRLVVIVPLVSRVMGESTRLEQEEATEDGDPHEVDEVPVVPDGLVDVGLARVAPLALHPTEEEDHGHQAEGHVEAVDAGHDEEEGPVGVE